MTAPSLVGVMPSVVFVTVTAEDVERSRAESRGPRAATCVVAQALGRAFPEEVVLVGPTGAHIGGHDYDLDVAAREVVRRFDLGEAIAVPVQVGITKKGA